MCATGSNEQIARGYSKKKLHSPQCNKNNPTINIQLQLLLLPRGNIREFYLSYNVKKYFIFKSKIGKKKFAT